MYSFILNSFQKPRSIHFYKTQRIIVKVLDEIPYERFAHLSVEETIPMVRNIIIENLNDLNKYTLID